MSPSLYSKELIFIYYLLFLLTNLLTHITTIFTTPIEIIKIITIIEAYPIPVFGNSPSNGSSLSTLFSGFTGFNVTSSFAGIFVK